jgi:very-short-patch-repair endonuclease
MGSLGRCPFIGSEAIAAGVVTKHRLRGDFRRLLPDVYVDGDVALTVRVRATAAWLWTHREGVIAGLTAAHLHGAKWVDDRLPVELIWCNARRPPGVRVFDFRLAADEMTACGPMRVTTTARTAFDLGRRGRLTEAVSRLDALGEATRFHPDDVLAVAARHRGARGLRLLATALDLHDPGAASPRETSLRLLLIGAGFPRPQTQIPVASSGRRYYLDMGWTDVKVAVEYDGDQHRLDRAQFVKDVRRLEDLREMGWLVVRVVAENDGAEVVDRVRRARDSRLR